MTRNTEFNDENRSETQKFADDRARQGSLGTEHPTQHRESRVATGTSAFADDRDAGTDADETTEQAALVPETVDDGRQADLTGEPATTADPEWTDGDGGETSDVVECGECGTETDVDAEALRLGGFIDCPICETDIRLDDETDDVDRGDGVATDGGRDADRVCAETATEAGATIRLVGREARDGWVESVEVVDDAGDVTTIYEDTGLAPTQVYNQVVDPFTDDAGRELVGVEESPECPECGGTNVVPAGKTEENCEDCAIFFVPGESDGIDRGDGIETDGGRDLDEIYAVIDATDEEGCEYHEWHGETIDGTPVLRLVSAATSTNPAPRCEDCHENRADSYRLADDRAGVPVCRRCLEAQPWFAAIEDDRDALMWRNETPPAGADTDGIDRGRGIETDGGRDVGETALQAVERVDGQLHPREYPKATLRLQTASKRVKLDPIRSELPTDVAAAGIVRAVQYAVVDEPTRGVLGETADGRLYHLKRRDGGILVQPAVLAATFVETAESPAGTAPAGDDRARTDGGRV